jgi:hypothetical protein
VLFQSPLFCLVARRGRGCRRASIQAASTAREYRTLRAPTRTYSGWSPAPRLRQISSVVGLMPNIAAAARVSTSSSLLIVLCVIGTTPENVGILRCYVEQYPPLQMGGEIFF